MALLDLVDVFLGSLFQGNIYSDIDTYKATIMRRPDGIDQQVENVSRGDIYQPGGTVPPNTVNQAANLEKNVPPPQPPRSLGRDEIYQKSNDLGALSSLSSFHSKRAGDLSNETIAKLDVHSHRSSEVIPTPDAIPGAPPGHVRNDDFAPNQHGTYPDTPPTPQNFDNGSTELRRWDNFDGVKRDNIYSPDNPPPDVISQKRIARDDPSYEKGQSYNLDRRADIYKLDNDSRKQQIAAGIGGLQDSPQTLGDSMVAQGKPPAPPLQQPDPFKTNEYLPKTSYNEEKYGVKNSEVYRTDRTTSVTSDFRNGIYEPEKPPTIPLGSEEIFNGADRAEFAPPQGRLQDHPDTYRGGNEYWDSGADIIRGGTHTLFPGESGPLRYFDPIAAAHWLRGSLRECYFVPSVQNDPITGRTETKTTDETYAKSAAWIASQFLLTAMNPTDPQGYGPGNAIWNPLSFAASAVPLLRSTNASRITAGAALGSTYKENAAAAASIGGERLLLMRNGLYVKSVDGTMVAQAQLPDAGFRGNLTKVGETDTIEQTDLVSSLLSDPTGKILSVREQVDTDLPGVLGMHGNLYNENRPYGQENAILPLVELEETIDSLNKAKATTPATNVEVQDITLASRFVPSRWPGDSVSDNKDALTWIAKPRIGSDGFDRSELIDAPGVPDNINPSVAFTQGNMLEDDDDGTLAELIDDKSIYMPFLFQDLRDISKYLYFRAFLKPGISETFTPEWQTERFYGRVDPVPIYQGTLRTFNFAFDVVAWGPHDLPVMYKKLKKLQSMVYPTYTSLGFLKAGPIIRMRVGDYFASANRSGLPGYLTAMDWSPDDGIWNIKTDFKVPRKMSVTLSYTVLHDGNPGIYPYQEGKWESLSSDVASADTEGITFGTGKFKQQGEKTKILVSSGEIRRIFDTVKKTGTK